MAAKTVKGLAKAIYRADIGMNADSEDYLKLAQELRPHLVKFFGEEIIDDTDPVDGTLYACISTVRRYRMPMPAKSHEEAMKMAEAHVVSLANKSELDKHLISARVEMSEASYDWDKHG